MRRSSLAALVTAPFVLGYVVVACAVPSINIRNEWRDSTAGFAGALQGGAGFSFNYKGKTEGSEFSSDWRQQIVPGLGPAMTRTVLTHHDGLVVTRETTRFDKFGAAEYRISFKNNGSRKLSPISEINAFDLSFDPSMIEGTCVISSGGGASDGFLPPRSYALRKNCFTPSTPVSGYLALGTDNDGRSSSNDLPFYFIHNDTKQQGMFIAFGWSGQWKAFTAVRPNTRTFKAWGRIPDVEIALEPGEEVQGPTILIGFYEGDMSDGSNQLRRLIRERYTPKLAGAEPLPVSTFWLAVDKSDEGQVRKLIDAAAAVHQEYYLLDAGWYKGSHWFQNVGNWEQVDNTRFPNGLKATADYVRAKGMKFGLWFEPERVAENSQLAQDHPEWILWKNGNSPLWIKDWFYPGEKSEYLEKTNGLLDFGRPEVQQYVRTLIDKYIKEYDVKYLRYDFNLNPLPYWEANDKPDRRGLTQLRHIQGFYAVIDWLRDRHPGVLFEGCASGGRRIDLETVRRFHSFWISDHAVDPAVIRFNLFGINHFLPGNYNYVTYTLATDGQMDFESDDLGFQSLYGGSMGTGGRIDLWPEQVKEKARVHIETQKQIRRYLMEDYYSLSKQPADLESWSAWQFDDPRDHSGFIQIFRTKTGDASHRFFVKGLDKGARYRFTDVYGAEAFEVSGEKAMMSGIEFTQESMSSRVFTYKIVMESVTSR